MLRNPMALLGLAFPLLVLHGLFGHIPGEIAEWWRLRKHRER